MRGFAILQTAPDPPSDMPNLLQILQFDGDPPPTNQPTGRPTSQPSGQPTAQPSFPIDRPCSSIEDCLIPYTTCSEVGTCVCVEHFYRKDAGDSCHKVPVGFIPVVGIVEASRVVGVSIGATNITACPPGSFKKPSAVSCTPCSPGSSAAKRGSVECTKCRAGTYIAEAGADYDCHECAKGSNSPLSGSSECEECAAGFYQTSSGSSTCTACPGGKASLSRGAIIDLCQVCPSGTFAHPGSSVCESSPPGTFTLSGSSEPQACPK